MIYSFYDLYINKYLKKNPINLEGIRIFAEKSKNKNKKLKWFIDNPNNIPFRNEVIIDNIFDSIGLFNKILGGGYVNRYTIEKDMDFSDIPSANLPNSFTNEVENQYRGIIFTRNTHNFKIKYKILSHELYFAGDGIDVSLKIELVDAEYPPISSFSKVSNLEDSFKLKIESLHNNDNLPEFIDEISSPVSDFIWNYSTICNKKTDYIMTAADFYNSNHNFII